MSKIFQVGASIFALSVCSGCAVPSKPAESYRPATGKSFVSVEPGKSDWVERQTGTGTVKQFWDDMSNKDINRLLPLERNSTSILRVQNDQSLGYAGAKYSGSVGRYIVVLDYSKYRDELTDVDKKPCLVGVGIRIKATITTRKSDLDLGSLFSIAYAAKTGLLSGDIQVTKIGVDSPQLTSAIPDFSEISDSSVQQALQAVGAVKNRLYDNDTKLTPHVLAVQFPVVDPPALAD